MTAALKIAYLGTRYCGWQVQKNGKSVQEALQDAMEAAFGTRGTVTGCSRTDAGVHAEGFICKAEGIPQSIPAEKIPLALGSRLPEDISVLEAWEVPEDFHPRYDAKGKEYVYRIRNSRVKDPFTAQTASLWQKQIDESACDTLCKAFTGKHDFRSFMAAGSDIIDTVRTVYDFSCKREGETVEFTVSADGFLYNMVRILVGTVLDLQDGVLEGTPASVLEAKDRSAAGRTMPPTGLCLKKVFY